MKQAAQPMLRDELRRAGLPYQGPLARLLTALREAPITHLELSAITRIVANAGLSITPIDMIRQLKVLTDAGLLVRLPSTGAEPIFDTVARPHFHLVYDEASEPADLDVSPETLLAILRQEFLQRPGQVEILVRFRRVSPLLSDKTKEG